jgi:hypothetical protein
MVCKKLFLTVSRLRAESIVELAIADVKFLVSRARLAFGLKTFGFRPVMRLMTGPWA